MTHRRASERTPGVSPASLVATLGPGVEPSGAAARLREPDRDDRWATDGADGAQLSTARRRTVSDCLCVPEAARQPPAGTATVGSADPAAA